MPYISVLMPVFNTKEEYLRKSIDSVLSQTFTDFELLILDNGSKPFVKNILKSYSDKRIRIFRKDKNIGPVMGRNYLLEQSKGDFISLMDSDDIIYPKKFEKQIELFEKDPNVGVVATDYVLLKDIPYRKQDFATENSEIKRKLLFGGCIFANSSIMVRKSVMQEHNIKYKREYIMAEDYKFLLDLLPFTDFAVVPEVLTVYRCHSESTTSNNRKTLQKSYFSAQIDTIEKFFNTKIQDKQILIDFYVSDKTDAEILDAVYKAIQKNQNLPYFSDFCLTFKNKLRTLFYHMHGLAEQKMLFTSQLSKFFKLSFGWRLFCLITRGFLNRKK